MPDIFAPLKQLPAGQLAVQSAMFSVVDTSNALLPYAQKAARFGASAINAIGGWFNKPDLIEEPSVVELQQRISEGVLVRSSWSVTELVSDIRSSVRKRLDVPEDASDTDLTTRMIEEAAKLYDISEWLTWGERAERISTEYKDRSLSALREKVSKMTLFERLAFESQIARDLDTLSPEQRRAIENDLNLKKLSGEALVNVLMTTGGPLATMAAISATGFGAYVALTTIIHAVATTALGITLPFAAYTTATCALAFLTGPFGIVLTAAALVFTWSNSERKLSRSLYAGLLTASWDIQVQPKPQELPAPASVNSISETDDAARQIKDLIREQQELRAALAERTRELSDLEAARAQASKLQHVSDALAERTREVQAVQEAATKAEAERGKRERILQQEIAELKAKARKTDEKREREESSEAKRIAAFWAIHFPTFTFERQPIR